MLSASLATLLSSLAHRLALKPHMALLSKPRDIQPRSGPFAIGSLCDMLVLWPVISWLNQEMPIIVNRSWGPQSSCRLHRLSYTSIVYRTPPSFIVHICMLRDMLVLWPVISWLNQEMPIIVNRSWGPQSSCRLHRLSYIFARYPRISVVYFVCVTSSCLPKSFSLLTDVLSYVCVPTCPSFNPISSLCAFEPCYPTCPSFTLISPL